MTEKLAEENAQQTLSFNELCKKRVELEQLKKQYESKLKEVAAEIQKLHKPLIMEMAQKELSFIPMAGGPRIQRDDQLFVNKAAGTTAFVIGEALKKCGLEWLIEPSYSPSRLKEWVKEELEKAGPVEPSEVLPEPLRDLFIVTEITRTKVIRAGTAEEMEGDS